MDYISPNQILFNYSNRFEAYIVSFAYTFSNIEKTKKKKYQKSTIALKSSSPF